MDERIAATQHQARSGGFNILFFGLLVVFLYRQFVLDESVTEHLDVAVVWLAAGLYATLAVVTKGVNPVGPARRKWIVSACAALAIAGVQVYTNAVEGVGFGPPIAWISTILTFIVGFSMMQFFQTVLSCLYGRWHRKNLE